MSSSILSQKYDLLSILGEGNSSTVFLGVNNETKRCVAIKRISKDIEDDLLTKVKREIQLVSRLRHPFIVDFHETFEDDSFYYIVTENCEGGSLDELIVREGGLNDQVAIMIMTELAFALSYLHKSQKVMHRDLKVENVLLDKHGHAKLGDFGFSTVFEDDTPMKRTACGSPAYAPPEMVMHSAYTNKADVWSLGVLLYVMLTSTFPFPGDSIQQCMSAILYHEPEYPKTLSSGVRELLQKMLEKDFEARLSIDEVLAHPTVMRHHLYSAIQKIADWPYTETGESMDECLSMEKMTQLGTKANGFRPATKRLSFMAASKVQLSAVVLTGKKKVTPIPSSESMRTRYASFLPKTGAEGSMAAVTARRVLMPVTRKRAIAKLDVAKTPQQVTLPFISV